MNRRQRRAGAATPSSSQALSSAPELPIAPPPPSPHSTKPKAKTLYEIAAEREAELSPHGQPFPQNHAQPQATKLVTITPDGNVSETTPPEAETAAAANTAVPLPPFLDTLLLSAPLSALNFTLSFLTHHQYAQPDLLSTAVPSLLKQTLFIAFPTLTLLIHLAHGHAFPAPAIYISPRIRQGIKVAQQLMFVITANIAGCYLIYLTNDRGYYAVMKRAPAIGTLWVWCVLELGLVGALAGVMGPGAFAWWNGYGVS